MSQQRGSVEVVIMAGLAIMLAVALGFIFWQNFIQTKTMRNEFDTANKTDTEVTKEEHEKEGVITGSLTYPSDIIPSTMEIYATNLSTNQTYMTNEQLLGDQYRYRVGYRLSVPEGSYYVYSVLSDNPTERHYYNNYVAVCNGGEYNECQDGSKKVVVAVEAGKETRDIIAGWSQPCLVPDSEQSTQKFDMPTC